MRLLVGLGNPGEQYESTRHNIGFVCLDEVASLLKADQWKSFKNGSLSEIYLETGKALVFKPLSFMNRSGQPIRQVMEYYDIALPDVCIVADDVYIAPGSARIRHSGADGGHNGWKSVIEHLGMEDYWRVKIGVGLYEQHPEKRITQPALDEFVLKPLPHHDQKEVKRLIDKLAPTLIEWLSQGSLTEETLHI